ARSCTYVRRLRRDFIYAARSHRRACGGRLAGTRSRGRAHPSHHRSGLGEPMRILITGGAGCLGSNLTEHSYPLAPNFLIIASFVSGRAELVPPLPRLELVEGTIADRDLVRRAFEHFSPTHVVHSAASYKDPTDWREDVETNVLGTINVVEAARDFGAARFVNF